VVETDARISKPLIASPADGYSCGRHPPL